MSSDRSNLGGLTRVPESELLLRCAVLGLRQADVDTPFPPSGVRAAELDKLNDAIASSLRDESDRLGIELIPDQPLPSRNGYGLQLHAKEIGGKTQSITFYRLKDTWVREALLLLGATLGIAMMSPAAAVPALNFVYNGWRNLLKLQRPQDALLIDTYKALLASADTAEGEVRWPAARTVSERSGLTIEDTVAGLKRLSALDLTEVAQWADHSHDLENEHNIWKTKI